MLQVDNIKKTSEFYLERERTLGIHIDLTKSHI